MTLLAEVLCSMFEIRSVIQTNMLNGLKKKDFWGPCKKFILSGSDFVKKLWTHKISKLDDKVFRSMN